MWLLVYSSLDLPGGQEFRCLFYEFSLEGCLLLCWRLDRIIRNSLNDARKSLLWLYLPRLLWCLCFLFVQRCFGCAQLGALHLNTFLNEISFTLVWRAWKVFKYGELFRLHRLAPNLVVWVCIAVLVRNNLVRGFFSEILVPIVAFVVIKVVFDVHLAGSI